jgi:hypothetical protein
MKPPINADRRERIWRGAKCKVRGTHFIECVKGHVRYYAFCFSTTWAISDAHRVVRRMMFRFTLLALGFLSLLTACNRELAAARAKLKNPSFSARLASECDKLVAQYDTGQIWLWKGDVLTNYPSIASIRPQHVKIVFLGGETVCDIQLTGGFSHAGILYVANPRRENDRLVRGSWTVVRIDQHFYWYRE